MRCRLFSRAAVHDGEATPASSARERKRLGARSWAQSPSSDQTAHGPPPAALRRRLEPSSRRLAPRAASSCRRCLSPRLRAGRGDHLPGLQTQGSQEGAGLAHDGDGRARRVLLAPTVPFGWIDAPPGANRLVGVLWLSRRLSPPGRRRTTFASACGGALRGLLRHRAERGAARLPPRDARRRSAASRPAPAPRSTPRCGRKLPRSIPTVG